MKTPSLSLIATLIVLVAVAGIFLITRPDEAMQPIRSNEPTPYIYYYSDLEHAFVIERADGTDSRLLAQDVMSEGYNAVDSVSFSPSGKWVAGRIYASSGPGRSNYNRFIFSLDGTQAFDLLDESVEVHAIEWSSTEDYVAILFTSHYHFNQVVQVIDVETNSILAEANFRVIPSFDRLNYPLSWTSDGLSVLFNYPTDIYHDSITRMNITGKTETWFFTETEPLVDYNDNFLVTREYAWQDRQSFFEWTITDLNTDIKQVFSTILRDDISVPIDYNFYWNHSRTKAIIDKRECNEERIFSCTTTELFLYDWNTNTLSILPDDMGIIRENNVSSARARDYWSPSDQFFLLQGENDKLYMLDIETDNFSQAIEVPYAYRQWLSNDKMLFKEDNGRTIYQYDITTQSLQLIDDEHYSVFPSPSLTYRGYRGQGNIVIQTVATGEEFHYPYHSYANMVSGFQWYKDEEWFFSGGGQDTGSYILMIHHLDSTIGRELTFCHSVQTCAGFVPDYVLPHLDSGQAESVTPSPGFVLSHEHSVVGVEWNSDGTKIATFTDGRSYEGDRLLSVWDMAGDVPVLEYEIATDLYCQYQIAGCSIVWENSETLGLTLEVPESRRVYFDLNTLESRQEIFQSEDERQASYQSADYQLNVTEDDNPLVYLINKETQARVSENPLQNMPTLRETTISYNANTHLLVWYSPYRRGTLWDVLSGEMITQLNWTGYMAQFNPDGTQLAVASDGFVSIWDMTPYIEQVHSD